MRHPLEKFGRGTIFHLLSNYYSGDMDSTKYNYHLTPNLCGWEDVEISKRILSAFKLAYAEEQARTDRPNQGVWEMVKHEFHGEAYKLLFAGEAQPLAEYLSNALRTPLCYGLGPGPSIYEALANPGDGRDAISALLIDRLISLSAAIGASHEENPEMGRYGEAFHRPLEDIVAEIEKAFGGSIGRAPVMGNFGIKLGNGSVIDVRVADDVYAAHRLRSLKPNGRIAEIGGGFGGNALQCLKAGLHPTIFDLPIVGAIQAFFLMKTLGLDQVRLYGETHDAAISVLPWWQFYDQNLDFDIVFNRDSMAEFPAAAAQAYLLEVRRRGIPYLSINQETEAESGQPGILQLSVARTAEACGLRREYRFRDWIRRGWIEELFTA